MMRNKENLKKGSG